MKNVTVVRYKQQLDDLFKKIFQLPEDAEMQSHWSRYLCIRVSGFLEVSVRSIYSQYAKEKASPFVANYIEKQLSGFQNPNMQKILNIAGSFNQKWSDELGKFIQGEIKAAKAYYQNAVKLVDMLEKLCED